MTPPDTRSPDTPLPVPNALAPASLCEITLDKAGEWIAAEDLREELLLAQQQGQGALLQFGNLRCSETTTLQVLLSAARGMRLAAGTMTDDLRLCLQTAGAMPMLALLLEVA